MNGKNTLVIQSTRTVPRFDEDPAIKAELKLLLKAAALMPDQQANAYVTEQAGHIFDKHQAVSLEALNQRFLELKQQKAALEDTLETLHKQLKRAPRFIDVGHNYKENSCEQSTI